MTLLLEVAKELFSMFLADARLTVATLVLVGLVAVLVLTIGVPPSVGGALLAIGCVLIVVEAAVREARRRAAR
jgi:hypothetical protein